MRELLPGNLPCKGAVVGAILVQVAFSLLASDAEADFYRYLGKDGVEVFTNRPSDAGAVRVMREAPAKSGSKREGKARHGAAREAKAAAVEQQPGGAEPRLPVKGVVTSNCGWRHDPIDGGIRHHNGVDIAVPVGTKVKAVAAGTVTESGSHGGYGNLVSIDHGNGMVSLYGHNSELEVKVGDQVQAGQTVALSGSTGRSTGPHLHFELWKRGVNVTAAYLNNGAGIPEVSGGIRTYLHKDGSIVFTNLR